jgi:hypothetical protein
MARLTDTQLVILSRRRGQPTRALSPITVGVVIGRTCRSRLVASSEPSTCPRNAQRDSVRPSVQSPWLFL